ncbi:MAG: transferase, partial [Promethearchaeota archaeon]
MEKVIIFGTGAFAQVAHFYLTKDSLHEVVAFTADEKFIQEKNLLGLPVIPFEEIEKIYTDDEFNAIQAGLAALPL